MRWKGKRLTVNGKQLTVNRRRLTVNRKQLAVLFILSILLISFITITVATGFFGTNTTTVSSLEKGLVAHYPLDGVYQTKDTVPYSNHATNYGATLSTGVRDEPNGAYSFDGSNSYVEIQDRADLRFTGEVLSISFWMYATGNGSGDFSRIIDKKTGYAGADNGYYLCYLDNEYLAVSFGNTYDITTVKLNKNTWYHVVAYADGSKWKVYVNGVLSWTATRSSLPASSTRPIRIGDSSADDYLGQRNFQGKLSDMKIYNRILTDSEIKLLYESYKPNKYQSTLNNGLISYWKLNSENGATDLVGNNHGVAQGGVTIGGVVDRKGKSDGATEFDGVNDYVQSLGNSMDEFIDVTFNFWIKPTGFATGAATSLISKRTATTNGYFIFAYTSTGNELTWDYGGTAYRWYTGYIPTLNKWQCITLTRNNSGRYLYVNGELYSSTPIAGNKDLLTNSNNMFVGADKIGSSDYHFKGSMQDIMIYNRSLTPDEVKELHQTSELRKNINLDKGLVGYWTLDIENGVKDLTPYGNHGVAQGGVIIGGVVDRKEKVGGATGFDGSVKFVNFNKAIIDTEEWTFSTWIKMHSLGSGKYQFIYSQYSDSSQPDRFHISYYNGKFFCRIGENTFSSTTSPEVGKWYYLTWVKTKNTYSVYIDGIKEKEWDFSSLVENYSSKISFSTSSYTLDGSVADMKIYNRALSEDEVKLLYESYKPKETSLGSLNKGLVLDMPLTTKWMKSDTIVSDRTPYGNDGVLMNGVIVGGGGSTFDGVNDYINLGKQNHPTDSITVSVMAKIDDLIESTSLISCTQSGGFSLMAPHEGKVSFYLYINGYKTPSVPISILKDGMNSIVGTYDGTYVKLYINGELVDSVSASGKITYHLTAPTLIGAEPKAAGVDTWYHKGTISNVKIYNRALTEDEVKLLYEKGM